MQLTAFTDWSKAFVASLAGAMALFFAAVPRNGFVLILVIGWIVASLLEKAIRGVLHAVNFDKLAQRPGVADDYIAFSRLEATPDQVRAAADAAELGPFLWPRQTRGKGKGAAPIGEAVPA